MIPIDVFGSEALDAPSLNLVGPVEIDRVYISAEKKGFERDRSGLRHV